MIGRIPSSCAGIVTLSDEAVHGRENCERGATAAAVERVNQTR